MTLGVRAGEGSHGDTEAGRGQAGRLQHSPGVPESSHGSSSR